MPFIFSDIQSLYTLISTHQDYSINVSPLNDFLLPCYSPRIQDTGVSAPLMHAIHGGHESTCLALLDASRYSGRARRLSDPDSSRMNEGHPRATPLHLASEKGLHRLVKALLAAGARIEARNENGATPLLHACRKVRKTWATMMGKEE